MSNIVISRPQCSLNGNHGHLVSFCQNKMKSWRFSFCRSLPFLLIPSPSCGNTRKVGSGTFSVIIGSFYVGIKEVLRETSVLWWSLLPLELPTSYIKHLLFIAYLICCLLYSPPSYASYNM